MVRADEAAGVLEVGGFAASVPLEVQQREIDHAIAHINSRADLQVFASDAFKIEHGLIEFCSLIEIVHTDGEVTQTGHKGFSSISSSFANSRMSRPDGTIFLYSVK